jgi:hypothetical protein
MLCIRKFSLIRKPFVRGFYNKLSIPNDISNLGNDIKNKTNEIINDSYDMSIDNAIQKLNDVEKRIIALGYKDITCSISVQIGPICLGLSRHISSEEKSINKITNE